MPNDWDGDGEPEPGYPLLVAECDERLDDDPGVLPSGRYDEGDADE